MIHVHSKQAFAKIVNSLSPKRKAVYASISTLGRVSNDDIANHLGWPINRVTGRVSELLQAGVIIPDGRRVVDGHPHRLVAVNSEFKVAA